MSAGITSMVVRAYFNAVRNTVSEQFIVTYPAGKARPSDTEIEAAGK